MTPTVLNFPSVANPARITWQLNRLDTRFKSPLSGTFQDIQRPGANWVCDMSWGVLSYADSQRLAAWSDQMSQAGVRTYLPNFIYIPQGSIKGVVIVNGANQTGTSLVCNQAPVGTNLVVAGDFIVITSGTHTQLLRITQNSSSDAAGNITLNFTPAMRFSPANGSQIYFGVTPTTAPAIYKSDWQGNQLQYSTPRTNILLYSDNLTNGVWTPTTGTTTTAGTNVGPDGTTSGGTISYDGTGTSGSYRLYQGAPIPPSGESWVASIWLKVASGTLNLRLTNNFHSIPITVTTSWQRFQVSGTSDGIGIAQIILYSASGDNSAWTVDYAFAQLEQASSATSYIPTTTAPVTVTDYTLAGNQLTFASAPANASTLTWTDGAGMIFNLPSGNGSTTVFYTGLPLVAFAFAKPSSSFTYTAPRIAALSLALEEDINV